MNQAQNSPKNKDDVVPKEQYDLVKKERNLFKEKYQHSVESYDQLVINVSSLENALPYLMEGMQVGVTEYDGEALEVEVPLTVEIPVTKAETGVKGDTATGATKIVTLTTGLEVQVPLFIELGDIVRIDTRIGKYLTRV